MKSVTYSKFVYQGNIEENTYLSRLIYIGVHVLSNKEMKSHHQFEIIF